MFVKFPHAYIQKKFATECVTATAHTLNPAHHPKDKKKASMETHNIGKVLEG